METENEYKNNSNYTGYDLSKDPDWTVLKMELNNVIWMHAWQGTTLKQAEEAACLSLNYLSKCYAEAIAQKGQP